MEPKLLEIVKHYSEGYLVELCRSREWQIIGDTESGRRIFKLSDDIIVKLGFSVYPEEASNQEHAFSCRSDLKIPKVHRYFRVSNVGYLFMEFVDGIRLDRIDLNEHPNLIPRLAEAIRSLTRHGSLERPGPRNGGVPRGYLFSENGAGESFGSHVNMCRWFNKRARLADHELGFDFVQSDCAFYHLDLARRNMILLPDDSFALLDWESAGFYPRVLEAYCLKFVGENDYIFAQSLMERLDEISSTAEYKSTEERQLRLLDRVFRNNLKYNFDKRTDHVKLQKLVSSFTSDLWMGT